MCVCDPVWIYVPQNCLGIFTMMNLSYLCESSSGLFFLFMSVTLITCCIWYLGLQGEENQAENAAFSLPSWGDRFWSWNFQDRIPAWRKDMRSPRATHMGWMRRTSYMHPRWRQTVSTSCPVHIYLFYFFKTSREKSKHDNTLEEPRCWLPTWYWYLHLVSDDYWECLVDFQVCIYSSLRSIVWATCSQRLSSNF